MRILLYVVIISGGAFLGYKELLSKKLISKLDIIQYLCLLFLLFLMGFKIGINRSILLSFHKLGLNAMVISLLSIIFSILGVKLVSKYLYSSKKVEQ